jgi:hypothetical protein
MRARQSEEMSVHEMLRYRSKTLIPNNAYVAKRMCVATALAMIAFGLLIEKPAEIIRHLHTYMHSSDVLVTDYFVIGSIGAAFFNSGLVMLIAIFLTLKIKTPYNGTLIAALFLMGGFALFGKTR